MYDFDIKVIKKRPTVINNLLSCWGQIRLGDFHEKFIMPLTDWQLKDYEQQWQEGIKRLEKEKQSCLVATVEMLKHAPLINWWILYKKKDQLIVQNHMLLGKRLQNKLAKLPFTPETCYFFIPCYKATTSDGIPVSQWIVTQRDNKK